MLPTIVIAGRPNVGKSTLFNRMMNRRIVITHSQPGVTRDYIEGKWYLGDRQLRLVDTGGIGDADANFDLLVKERSFALIQSADVVLLVLDFAEYTPEDQEIVEYCRKYPRCILVLNKADKKRIDPALERNLGFVHVVEVSAAHGRGIKELETAVKQVLSQNKDQSKPDAKASKTKTTDAQANAAILPPKNTDTQANDSEQPSFNIAILGKPNSGKSCLLNALLGYERSLVCDIAGTTRDSVDAILRYKGRDIRIIDTAGLRRQSKVSNQLEYFSNMRAVENARRADVVFLLIEATQGLSDQDKKIAHVAIQSGKAVIFVLSKWDLVKHAELRELKAHLRFLFPHISYAPILACSSLTGEGMHALLDEAMSSYKQLYQQITTATLNKQIIAWQDALTGAGRRVVPVRYATQLSNNPVKFLLFAKRELPAPHHKYFVNCIRKHLGFTKVPVSVEVRSGR